MRKFVVLVAATVALSGCARIPFLSSALPAPEPILDMSSPLYGPNFLHMATSSNLWEIQSSRLALQVSANPDVRSFAEMIIADHTQFAGIIAAADKAADLGPPPPEALMPFDQAKIDQLRATPASSFDSVYKNMQVAAHQQAIQLFQTYAASGDNAVLRSMAAQAIPTLQRHLAAAEALQVAPSAAPLPLPHASPRSERG